MRNDRHDPERLRGLRAGGSGHAANRSLLRGLGLLMVVTGGLFALVGFVDFFAGFGAHRAPTKFWCLFVGMPLVGVGVSLLKMGYLGAVTRYVAAETVPVARDSAVEVAEGLRPTIRDIAADLRGTDSVAAASPQADPAARLARLEKLRADGLITEREHAEQRARILGEL